VTNEPIEPAEGDRIVQLIAAGRFDDRISDVIEAVQQRFIEEAVSVAWTISEAGKVLMTEQDMTVDEAATWKRLTGFLRIREMDLTDPDHYRAAKAIALARTGATLEEATERAGAETLADMLHNVGQMNRPPLPAAPSAS
jgi:hypothetical protein